MHTEEAGDEDDDVDRPGVALLASRLSFAGFVPAAALTLWLAGIASDHPWRDLITVLLSAYAALALAFLAGVRWGLAFRDRSDEAGRDVLIGIAPAIAGWTAVVAPAPYAFVILALAFAAHGAWDAFGVQAGTVPVWYGRVRTRMTFLMVAAMIVAFVATN